MSQAATELSLDYFALDRALDEAAAVLGFDPRRLGRGDPDLALRRVVRDIESLAADLHRRVAAVRQVRADVGELNRLNGRILAWAGPPQDDTFVADRARRHALLLSLLGGDVLAVGLVAGELDRGLSYGEAIDAACAELVLRDRVAGIVSAFGITTPEAREHIARIDADLTRLHLLGFDAAEAEAVVALGFQYAADLDAALAYAADGNASLIDAMGRVIAGQGLGVSAHEFDALMGLREYFPELDRLPGSGISNDRVTIEELEHIVSNECRYTDGQVMAAAALLANPMLLNRLDTAGENDEVLGAGHFGNTERGDGVISYDDLEAFLYKAQLTHILAPFADEIDIAADPLGEVDGVHSRRDLEDFLAGASVNELPESATVALNLALENGWFDQSWLQEHREELAYAAAMVAGGAVVILSAGTATPMALIVTAGVAGVAGGVAAGSTILAVNSLTDDELTDGLARGVATGIFIGVGSASMVGNVSAASAGSGLRSGARTIAAVKAAGDAAGVVSQGAADILMPEDMEEPVKDVAKSVNAVVVGGNAALDPGAESAAGVAIAGVGAAVTD